MQITIELTDEQAQLLQTYRQTNSAEDAVMGIVGSTCDQLAWERDNVPAFLEGLEEQAKKSGGRGQIIDVEIIPVDD